MKNRLLFLGVLLWMFAAFVSAQVPPEHIQYPAQLQQLADYSRNNDCQGLTYYLDNDIDLTNVLWQPIGSKDRPFQGTFDGQGHVIRNLHIENVAGPVGLFGEIGSSARIHHVGLAQGLIFLNGIDSVGALVGVNRGTIDHCFNMVEITAKNGSCVGGLVGTNYGKIEYSYNNGIISDASSKAGGLVGWNKSTGELKECYNTGYIRLLSAGALFGQNDADASKRVDVYYDQQVTVIYAVGTQDYGKVEKTADLKYKFANKEEWIVSEELGRYPELKDFGTHPASILSSYSILLDTTKTPIERAEEVAKPVNGQLRKEFALCVIDGQDVKWGASDTTIIKFSDDKKKATVIRPCGASPVIITDTLGDFVKQIYTNVQGFSPFNEGKLSGSKVVCFGDSYSIPMLNDLQHGGLEAYGGKDDEPNEKGYSYKIEIDTVTIDGTDTIVGAKVADDVELTQNEYGSWNIPTEVPGMYAFKRYAKDAQCADDYKLAEGQIIVKVLPEFKPGELYDKPDTIYLDAESVEVTILSKELASGGDGDISYSWRVNNGKYDINLPSTAATCTFTIDENVEREYTFYRTAKDGWCKQSGVDANPHKVKVFSTINPGAIKVYNDSRCIDTIQYVIKKDATIIVKGGNGNYQYRWLHRWFENDVMQEEVVEGATGDELNLGVVTATNALKPGDNIFLRQIKDDSGLMEWIESVGQDTIHVFPSFTAGAITDGEQLHCFEVNETVENLSIKVEEITAVVMPEGNRTYGWLLRKENSETLLEDTIKSETLNELEQTIPMTGLSLPVTIVVERIVQNDLCDAKWQKSEGLAKFIFSRKKTSEEHINVCVNDLPYHGEIDTKFGKKSYTFNKAGDEVVIADETNEGCEWLRTLICDETERASVTIQPDIYVCDTVSEFYLHCKVEKGDPKHYAIQFSNEALAVGFESVTDVELPAGKEKEIAVVLPANTPLGTYTMAVSFYSQGASGECLADPIEVSFRVDMGGYIHRKGNNVLFVDNSGKAEGEPLTFVSYQWFLNGEPIEGATGQAYYEYNGLNGLYSVDMTTADGTVYHSCQYDMRPLALDNIGDGSLQLYPIPVTASGQVQVNSTKEGTLYLYNLQGVCCGAYTVTAGTNVITAPAAEGMYLVRLITSRNESVTRKMIVQ